MNINVFSFFDDEGRARHLLVISLKTTSELPIYSTGRNTIPQSQAYHDYISDITKHTHQKHFCLRCLGHFSSEEALARHNELCTRDDFMSVFHVLPTPGSKQAEIKFNQYKYCIKAPIVINADFQFILEPSGRQIKHTTYTQQHKVCAAVDILTSIFFYNFDQRTLIKVGENALAEFLDSLIV